MRPNLKKNTRHLMRWLLPGAFITAALFFSGQQYAQPLPKENGAKTAEDEAYSLMAERKWISARTKAEEALRADPDSITAHFVMGAVYHEAEGSLARAHYHFTAARRLFEDRYGIDPAPGALRDFHQILLQHMQRLAGQMERYDEQLQLIHTHDLIYEPDLLGERAWALLQQRRFDEARKAARQAIQSTGDWEHSLGLNALCAIEGEAQNRQAYYDACLAALQDARADNETRRQNGLPPGSIAVDAYNASGAAFAVLRFDEAEKFALEGANAHESTVANPYRTLSALYLMEGRFSEAVSGALEMQKLRRTLAPSLRDHDRAETDAALAALLYAFGEHQAGLQLISRAIERPDRRGLISSKHEQAAAGYALLRRGLLHLKAEHEAEQASTKGIAARVNTRLFNGSKRIIELPDEERIVSLMAETDSLIATFRMHVGGGIIAPEWMLGDLTGILGAGVVEAAVQRAREMDAGTPGLEGYTHAILAEVLLAQGNESMALYNAKQAVATLPQAQALMRARAAAVGGYTASLLGDSKESYLLFAKAMDIDPGVIRRLGMAIPAEVRAESGGAAEEATEMLRRSPRLDLQPGAFTVSVSGNAHSLKACLLGADGAVLSCAQTLLKQGEELQQSAARLALAFHKNAFGPRVSLTTGELHSLDGSTTLAADAQRDQMQDLLRSMAEQSPIR